MKRLWLAFAVVLIFSFSILGWVGTRIYQEAPPLPDQVVATVGLMQTWASVDKGYWYARSPEFMHTDVMQTLRWMRVPGDSVFALGAVALVWFVAGLKTGHSLKR